MNIMRSRLCPCVRMGPRHVCAWLSQHRYKSIFSSLWWTTMTEFRVGSKTWSIVIVFVTIIAYSWKPFRKKLKEYRFQSVVHKSHKIFNQTTATTAIDNKMCASRLVVGLRLNGRGLWSHLRPAIGRSPDCLRLVVRFLRFSPSGKIDKGKYMVRRPRLAAVNSAVNRETRFAKMIIGC